VEVSDSEGGGKTEEAAIRDRKVIQSATVLPSNENSYGGLPLNPQMNTLQN
jgi:hypothetical protein